jgi:hypothetical protein
MDDPYSVPLLPEPPFRIQSLVEECEALDRADGGDPSPMTAFLKALPLDVQQSGYLQTVIARVSGEPISERLASKVANEVRAFVRHDEESGAPAESTG